MADLKPFTGELDAPTSLKPFDGQLDGEKAKPAGAMRKLGDLGLGFASGAVGATKALADAAGAGNSVSGALGTANEFVNDYLSPEAKADQQEQGAIMAEAKGKGTWEGIKAGARAFGVAPVQTAVQGLGSIVPVLAGGLAGLPGAAATGIALGAGTAKGAIFDEVKKRGIAKGLTEAQATAEADQAQSYGGDNTDQIALGGALGAADALTGVSAGATRMVRGALGKPVKQAVSNGAEAGILKRAGMGVLKEMPLEAAQGGQEQVAANVAAQRAGYEAGTFDNVASNATLEALASAGPGAAFGAMNTQAKQTLPPVVPPAIDQLGGLPPTAPAYTPAPSLTGTNPADLMGSTIGGMTGGGANTDFLTGARDANSSGMGYNPDAGAMTQFPDGSQSFTSEVPPVVPIKPSEAMGINPTAGPISAAAALSVDAGITQEIQVNEANAADQAAYEQATSQQEAQAAEQAAEQDTANQPITHGKIPESALSDEDKRAILFSNQAVADGGRRYTGTQDGDILNGEGKPYSTRFAAARRANMEGKDWTIAPVFDGFVARRKDATNVSPTAGTKPGSTEPTGPVGDNAAGSVESGRPDRQPEGLDGVVPTSGKSKTKKTQVGETIAIGGKDPKTVTYETRDDDGRLYRTIKYEDGTVDVSFAVTDNQDNELWAGADTKLEVYPRQLTTEQAAKIANEDVVGLGGTPSQVTTSPVPNGNSPQANESVMEKLSNQEQSGARVQFFQPPTEKHKKGILYTGEIVTRGGKQVVTLDKDSPSFAAGVREVAYRENGGWEPAQPVTGEGAGASQPTQVAAAPAATKDKTKALDRIAKGMAYFGNAIKAAEFIHKNGLKETHKAVKTSDKRWDIVSKQDAPVAPADTAPAAIEPIATTQGKDNGTQTTKTQPQQAKQPTETPEGGLTNAAPTANPGAQAASAGSTQGETQTPDQRRRTRLEREIASGKTNNGGVVARLRPFAIEKRKQELAAMGERGRMPDAPGKAPVASKPATEKGLGEQLAELNAELERQGAVQNANTRERRDSIRKQIAEQDFPEILKAVDDNIDVAEELNRAFQYAGDEPKAKTIERVLKKRGITPEYRARWTERLLEGQQDEKPSTVNVPATAAEAFTAQMQKQKGRITRLKNEAEKAGSLEDKRAAQLKVTAAEATLRQMRLKIFDAEDAAVKSIDTGDAKQFSEYADLFPVAAEEIAKLTGQNDELDAEMQSYEAKKNPTYSGEPARDSAGNVIQRPKLNGADRFEYPVALSKTDDPAKTVAQARVVDYMNGDIDRPTLVKALEDSGLEQGTMFAITQRLQGDGLSIGEMDRLLERREKSAKPAAKPDAKAALSEREKAAKAKMFNALGKLAALASKNTRMNWTPEEEQQLLPIVIELFDGAMDLGSVTFQKAVRYVREFISANLDKETADAIPFETLQGAYIHTARKFKDQGATPGKEVMSFDSLEELEKSGDQADTEPTPQPVTDEPKESLLGANDDTRRNATTDSEPLDETLSGGREGDGAGGNAATGDGLRSPDAQGDGRPESSGAGRGNSLDGSEKPVLPGTPTEIRPLADGPVGKTEDRPQQLSGENPGNFAIADDFKLGQGTDGDKISGNLNAIRTLRQIQSENRYPTKDEQAIMARYVGWGGLKSVFDPKKEKATDQYGKAQRELKTLLSADEYRAANGSIRNAHYTAEGIVDGMWRVMRFMGFKGGRALEPTVGIGNFIGRMPADMAASTEWHASELDTTTGQLAAMLYPEANILASTGFEDAPFADGAFDISVGNPPFGSQTITDKSPNRKHLNGQKIHNYIIAKSGMHLRPGGVMSMVVTHRFLDTANPEARDVLAKDFRFLGAFRLPNDAFKKNAGTDVVTDVVFLQKLGADEKRERDASWLDVNGSIDMDGQAIRVNRYYQDNPAHILGRSAMDGSMQRSAEGEYTVHSDGRDIGKAIDSLMQTGFSHMAGVLDQTNNSKALAPAMLTQSNLPIGGVMVNDEGKVVRRELNDDRGNAVVQEITADTLWKDQALEWQALRGAVMDVKKAAQEGKVTADDANEVLALSRFLFKSDGAQQAKPTKAVEAVYKLVEDLAKPASFKWSHNEALLLITGTLNRKQLGDDGYQALKGMLDLRNRTLRLIMAEQSGGSEMEAYRADLNRAYDAFVKSHGFLSDPKNANLLEGDVGAEAGIEANFVPSISAAVAKSSGTPQRVASAKKSDIMSQRVNFPYKEISRADSPADALFASISEHGKVDLPYMAKITNQSVKSVIEALTKGDNPQLFRDPETGEYQEAERYLSGNVKHKLQKAMEHGLESNIKALEKSLPADKSKDQVKPNIRGIWMPPEIFTEFLEAVGYTDAKMTIIPSQGILQANGERMTMTDFGVQFKHGKRTPMDMFNSQASGKPIIISNTSNGKTYKDEQGTKEVNALAERMGKVFQEWAYADDNRVNRIVAAFNQNMNTHTPRTFDGVKYLKPVGASPSIVMRKTQMDGAWRMMQERTMLADHVVGAGKTYTLITGIMERRRMGLSRKPMVVVPNHLVTQWARDFYKLYPGAKVLAASPADFAKKNRRRLLARIATGDYDAVIVGHTSIGFMETPAEDLKAIVDEKLAGLKEALAEARKNNESKRTLGQIEDRIDRYKERLKELAARPTDDIGIDFKALGIDHLSVDEAHEFKNLEYSTSGDRVVGMNDPNGSKKAFDLYSKVRGLLSRGGGVTFATGTPVSNSLVEIYTMMSYLAHDELVLRGQEHFDSWSGAYAATETRLEYTATQKLKPRRVLAGLNNLSALRQLYEQFADIITMSDLKRIYTEEMEQKNLRDGTNLRTDFPIPKVAGERRQLVSGDITPAQKEYMDYLVARMAQIEANKSDKEYMRIDNALNVLTDARKMSLDIRIVDPAAQRDENGKVATAAKNIKATYDKWEADRGTQLVFCDLSTPAKTAAKEARSIISAAVEKLFGKDLAKQAKQQLAGMTFEKQWEMLKEKAEEIADNPATSEEKRDAIAEYMSKIEDPEATMNVADIGFSVYDDLKTVLMESGIPESEIAFIHDYNTPEQKDKLFDRVNNGYVRVLIGSSMKMGAGMNVQERLVALHHMDAPWRPSDVEQREGRIIRQKNSLYLRDPDGFEVEIKAYSTNQTSDTVMWQILERKSGAIEQFRNGGLDSVEEEGGDSNQYAEFMATSTGNPVFRQKLEAERNLTEIESEIGGALIVRSNATSFLESYGRRSKSAQDKMDAAQAFDASTASYGGESGTQVEFEAAMKVANDEYLTKYAVWTQKKADADLAVAKWEVEPESSRGDKPSMPTMPSQPDLFTKSVQKASGYARAIGMALDEVTVGKTVRITMANGAIVVDGADFKGSPYWTARVSIQGESFMLDSSGAQKANASPRIIRALTPFAIANSIKGEAKSAAYEIDQLNSNKILADKNALIAVSTTARDAARAELNWLTAQVAFAEVEADIARGTSKNRYIERDKRRNISQTQSAKMEAPTKVVVDGVGFTTTGLKATSNWQGVIQATRDSDGLPAVLVNTNKVGEFGAALQPQKFRKTKPAAPAVSTNINQTGALEGNTTDVVFSARDSSPAKELPIGFIQTLVKAALRGIPNAPTIEVFANPAAAGLNAPSDVVVSGAVTADGRIYVFQSGVGSAIDVQRVIFHELFHKGLQNAMAPEVYEAAMLEFAAGDARLQQLANDWKNTNAGQAQRQGMKDRGLTGSALTSRFEALAIEEGMAGIAEELKAERAMGTKTLRLRKVAKWLATLADKMGLIRLADSIRAMSYTEAEKFVMATIGKSGGKGPGGGARLSTKDRGKNEAMTNNDVSSLRDGLFKFWTESSLAGKSSKLEGGPDGGASNSKSIPDLLESKSFRLHGFSGLDIPSQRKVMHGVLSLGNDREVLRAIVQSIPVDVVNNLGRKNISTDSLFSDEAVLKRLLSSDINGSVSSAIDVADALVAAVTRVAAKMADSSARMTARSGELNPALGANIKDGFHDRILSDINRIGNQGWRSADDSTPGVVYKDNMPPERDGFMRLYHGGSGDTKTGKDFSFVPSGGVFDGFFSRPDPASSWGSHGTGHDYFADIHLEKILSAYDLSYEVPYEKTLSAFEAVTRLKEGDDGFDVVWAAVIEDNTQKDEDALVEALGADDLGDAGWMSQKMRGQVAKKLGYDAIQMEDEHGDGTYLIVSGVKVTRALSKNESTAPDSGGAMFSRTDGGQTQTESFRKWFGDSKVVDVQGKPLAVYHGSKTAGITEFNTNAESNDGERGTFFSAKESATKDYGSSVYEAHLSLQNPYEVTAKEWHTGEGMSPVEAKSAGHDGYIIRGLDGKDGDAFIAFEPNQIKSIGNNGNFDTSNPDIRFSIADTLTDAANNTQEALKNATVTDLLKQFGNRLGDFRGLGLQTLGRRQLVDIYGKDLPAMVAYSDMVAQMEADKNESGAEADGLATDWGKLKDERQLAELMHDATLAQIDPSKDFVEGDDANFYDALKDGYDKLTPDAKKVFLASRDMYSAHNENVRKAIRERITRSELSSTKKQALLERMDGEFFKKVKGVYFPLARFGSYVTIVKDSEGNVVSANRSETMNEAEATRKVLQTQFPASGGFKVGKVLRDREFNAARDGVGRGFMADLFQTLEKTGAGEELMDSISQLYLAALPDLSWAKHGIHRKGTPGFSQDARRAFAQNMFHGARYLAKLRYADQLQAELDTMQKQIADQVDNEAYDSVKAQQVVDEMVKRHESLMNPASNPLSTALTSIGFVFHLGLSPASALVNLSQTALVALPIMGAKWGFTKSSAALLVASKQAAGNKNDISTVLKGDERMAYDEAVRRGVIDVTMAHDLSGIALGEDSKVSAAFKPVMKYASFLFHHAEKFNRQVTFVASYRLAREAGTAHEAAFDDAVKATYGGHFDYGAANRPRLMQGNVARVVFLFKQYSQNMIYTLTRSAQQAIKAETPEGRAEARKALAGLLVSHAMAAGVFGLPVVGMLLSAASAIGGDDDEPWDAKVALQNMLADTLGKKPAEVFAHGLSRLTPWDISGRVGLDKLLLPDVQEGLEGADAVKNWMAAALGPVAGIAVNAGKGMQDMANGQYARGLESMLPSALRSPLKAYRYGTEGNIDKSGVAINDEIGAAGVAGQALGFSPSEARLAQEGKSAIYSADRAIQARRSSLTRQFALAAMAKDQDGMTDARKDIARFNEKNPKARITPINLMQSVRARRKRIEQAEQGVYLPKKRQDAIEAGRFALAE